ncbi:MAG: sugar phosphate isomerase/epimerase [Eubacteriales bacterium]
MKIGVQLYSVRDYAEKDFARTMSELKKMGYDGVELAGGYGLDAAFIRKTLDECGLEGISAHVQLSEMYNKPEETFTYYQTIGCRYIAVPWMGEEGRPSGSKFQQTLEQLRVVGAEAKKYGIQLLYHNHDFEFVKCDGKYGLDVMYETVPADLLQTEIDTCWVNIAGVNPAAYVLKYTGRAPLVHLKDFHKKDGAARDGLYELIGINKKAAATKDFEFRAVGHGMQDIPAIVDAAEQAGASWLIVELDRTSQGLTSMESIDISRKYLRSINL